MTTNLPPTRATANAFIQSLAARLPLFMCAFALALVCILTAAPLGRAQALPASDSRVQSLRMLGEAYAKDLGLTLDKIEVSVAGKVNEDASVWAQRLVDALAIGYRPTTPNSFRLVPFLALKPILKVKMKNERSPEETVARAVNVGSTVLQVSWYFSGTAPVKSYAVFSANGAPAFDTMLLMPAIQGPVLSIGHGTRQ